MSLASWPAAIVASACWLRSFRSDWIAAIVFSASAFWQSAAHSIPSLPRSCSHCAHLGPLAPPPPLIHIVGTPGTETLLGVSGVRTVLPLVFCAELCDSERM